ncbi:MAG: hypothetical protein ACXVRS_16945 [Gaiellaceae bacterium]
MDEKGILAGGDSNVAEFMRRMARAESGSLIYEEDGLLLVAAHHPNPGPYRNAAVLTRDGMAADHAVAVASEFFAARNRGFVLWVRHHDSGRSEFDAIAAERGWTRLEDPGLPQLWQEGPPDPAEPGEGITLVSADDEQTWRDFVQVNAEAWGLEGIPFGLATRIICEPTMFDDPTKTMVGVVAYLDGRPASACLALVYPERVVGGYWGATSPWALGHGLHDLTTRAAYNEAFARWVAAEISVCQNSPGAAKTLARMGFQPISMHTRYLVPKQ